MGTALYFVSFTISSLSSILTQFDTRANIIADKLNLVDDFAKEA
jgi:hypothetical protein